MTLRGTSKGIRSKMTSYDDYIAVIADGSLITAGGTPK